MFVLLRKACTTGADFTNCGLAPKTIITFKALASPTRAEVACNSKISEGGRLL